MDENNFFMRYDWSEFVDGGFISPAWTWSPGKKPRLVSVALYGPNHNFCGTWHRANMPLPLIRWLERVIQNNYPYVGDDPQRVDV